VATYEQDWLGTKAQAELNLVDRDAFLGNMASACKRNGVTIQYCMPLPRHYLQSVKYDNVTTIRTSQDRFGRSRWDQFLFGSRLAGALGLWPFSDVFLSTEADNLLVATLSAGPVGVGDPIGFLNAANLRRAARQDGVDAGSSGVALRFPGAMLRGRVVDETANTQSGRASSVILHSASSAGVSAASTRSRSAWAG